MFNFFRNNKRRNQITVSQFQSDSFSKNCLEKIREVINSAEYLYGNSDLFYSLLSLIQIGEDSMVLTYIDYITPEGKANNRDTIYQWLATFSYRFDDLEKHQYYIDQISDITLKDYLIEDLEKVNFKDLKNVEFPKPPDPQVSPEIDAFFQSTRTPNEIQKLIDSIVLAAQEGTNSKDRGLLNVAYQFEKIVLHLVNINQIESALIFLDSFPNKAPKWNAIKKLAFKIGETDYKTALKYLKSIKDDQIQAASIVQLALNLYKSDDCSTCVEVVGNLSPTKNSFKDQFYVRLIEKLIKDDQFENALNQLDKIHGHDNDRYEALLLLSTKAIIENVEFKPIDYVSSLTLSQNRVKFLSALIAMNNEILQLGFKCVTDYFLPARFNGHEIEFWKIYNKA